MMTETDINEAIDVNDDKNILKFFTFSVVVFVICFTVYVLSLGVFEDKNILINYIGKFGLIAPIIFILLQILQVIIPIIPGNVICLVGVLAFGPVMGFIYNYIGLIIGYSIGYFLAKRYGLKLIKKLFKEETINKYMKYIQNNKFTKIFGLAILLPGLPDDLLCYLAGISSIKFKTFILIVLFGKPVTLVMYSLFMNIL